MDWSSLLQHLITAGEPVIYLAWTLLMAWVARELTKRMKTGAARDVALELASVADVSVRYVAQRVRPALEARAADGKLSDADLEFLKQEAMAAAKDQLSTAALRLIESNSTRLEDVLGRAIEAAVLKEKQAAALAKPLEGELLSTIPAPELPE